MSRTASEHLVEALEKTGVKRVYGVVGDSLNGFTDALRRRKSIDWIHMRHEEAAAFAAGAEAHLTGSLAVCAGSCGPGNLHLINGLFDCQRNGVPVLAKQRNRDRLFPGNTSGKPVQGLQPLCRAGFQSETASADIETRNPGRHRQARRCSRCAAWRRRADED